MTRIIRLIHVDWFLLAVLVGGLLLALPAGSSGATRSRAAVANASSAPLTAYVTSSDGGTVTPIAVATNTPGTPIPVGSTPFWVAITPDGKTAYATNIGGSSVTPITLATNTPGTPIAVGNQPIGIAVSGIEATPPTGLIAFISDRSDAAELWVMNADGSHPVQLTHDDGEVSSPQWSADGSRLAVSTRAGFAVMSPDGSGRVDFPGAAGASLSPDGTHVTFTRKTFTPPLGCPVGCINLYVSETSRDDPTFVATEDARGPGFPGPAVWAPDSRTFTFLFFVRDTGEGIATSSVAGGATERFFFNSSINSIAVFSDTPPTIAFVPEGEPFIDVVRDSDTTPARIFTGADCGGVPCEVLSELSLSPDGQRSSIVRHELGDGTRLAFLAPSVSGPWSVLSQSSAFPALSGGIWSPDSTKRAELACPTVGTCGIFVFDGSTETKAFSSEETAGPPSPAFGWLNGLAWSPEGSTLAVASNVGDPNGRFRIFAVSPSGGAPVPLTAGSSNATSPAWQPGSPAPVNYAPEPDLEASPAPSYFTNGPCSFSWATDASHSPTHALKISSTTSTLCRWLTETRAIGVTPGTSYDVSGWLKTLGTAAVAHLSVNFWDKAETYIPATVDAPHAIHGPQDWTQLSLRVTAPAKAAFLRVELRLNGPGTLWADDLAVAPVGAAPPPPPPVSTSPPLASGLAQPGQTLTTSNGGWTDQPTRFDYQWLACTDASSASTCTPIAAATAATYSLTSAELSHWIRARVRATGSGGTAEALSNALGPVVEAPPSSGNLARDAGVELEPSPYYFTGGPCSFNWATDASHSPAHALKIGSTTSTLCRWLTETRTIKATPGALYDVSAWLKTLGTAAVAHLSINFWDRAETYIPATVDAPQAIHGPRTGHRASYRCGHPPTRPSSASNSASTGPAPSGPTTSPSAVPEPVWPSPGNRHAVTEAWPRTIHCPRQLR